MTKIIFPPRLGDSFDTAVEVRVTETESDISDIDTVLTSHGTKIGAVEGDIGALQTRPYIIAFAAIEANFLPDNGDECHYLGGASAGKLGIRVFGVAGSIYHICRDNANDPIGTSSWSNSPRYHIVISKRMIEASGNQPMHYKFTNWTTATSPYSGLPGSAEFAYYGRSGNKVIPPSGNSNSAIQIHIWKMY